VVAREPADPEPELVRRFFDGIDRFIPQIVSWNGSGFDLPVLHYRALMHGISAARYWDLGDDERDFRYNNYLNRYHTRHLDLMDVLSAYQPRATTSSTRWRDCAASRASWGWTAARCSRRCAPASSTLFAATARRT
jgi:predicted PolB exonuclease-like 3'-5' exonuclease